MQIVRLKLLSDFRSLKKGFEMTFATNFVQDQIISPTCIVGKNGSGKSNLLELICEMFFYLDSLLLEFPSDNLLSKKRFGFEIEYQLDLSLFDSIREWLDPTMKWSKNFVKVRVIKKINEKPEYSLIDLEGKPLFLKMAEDTIRELHLKQKHLLPKQIIGYSSGLNELISNPFTKMQFHYFHEYQARLTADILDSFEDGRLLYMNYESNAAILIANLLLQEEKVLDVLEDEIGLSALDSFRITVEIGNTVEINSDSNDNKGIADITDFFRKEIEYLGQLCTTQTIIETEDTLSSQIKKTLVFDYKVTKATIEGFRHFFGNSENFYKFLHRLNLINIHKIPVENREKIRNAIRGQSISNLLPKVAAEDLIFKIDNIILKKRNSADKIFYSRLSDGEHQFVHIIGTYMILNDSKSLFILDEPETHLNPKWRSKLVSTLNKIEVASQAIREMSNLPKKYTSSEMFLSTHSPFILSDSSNSKVWKFNISNNIAIAHPVKFKTFGASFSILLDEVLEKEESISEMSNKYISEIRIAASNIVLSDENAKYAIEELKQKVLALGESPEKFELFSFLTSLSRSTLES